MVVFVILSPGASLDGMRYVLEQEECYCKDLSEFVEADAKIVYTLSWKDIDQLDCYSGLKIMFDATEDEVLAYFRQLSDETQAEIEFYNYEQADYSEKADIRIYQTDTEAFVQLLRQEFGEETNLMQQVQEELVDDVNRDYPLQEQEQEQAGEPVEPEEQAEDHASDVPDVVYEQEDVGQDGSEDQHHSDPDVEELVPFTAQEQNADDAAALADEPENTAETLMEQSLLILSYQLDAFKAEQLNADAALLKANQELRRTNAAILQRLYQLEQPNQYAYQPKETVEAEPSRRIDSRLGSSPMPPQMFKSHLSGLYYETQIVKRQILKPHRSSYSYANIPNYIPIDFVCKICLEPFVHPVTLPCGHSFCSLCLLLSQDYFGCCCPECRRAFQTVPYVDYYLQQKVQAQCNFDESVKKGDFVTLIDGSFGQILDITKSHYDFELHQLSADIAMPLIDIARVYTNSGIVKSEVFNLTRFSPQYQRVATRIRANSFLVKAKPPQRLEYSPEDYSPFVQKFYLIPSYSYCQAQYHIFQLDGFYNQQFRLRDTQGNVFAVDTLDDYLALDVENDMIQAQADYMCMGCYQSANLAVQTACGHRYCLYCAVKLIRNQLPCLLCGEQMQIMQERGDVLYCPEINEQSQFLDNDFMVFCDQKIQFVVQILAKGQDKMVILQDLEGSRQLYRWAQVQAIPFNYLVPALRPIAGDIVVYLGKSYKSLAYADGQAIIGPYRRAAMFKAAYLVQNIRLIQRTDLTERMCIYCRQIMRRPVQMKCGHRCCRTCAIISCVGGISCFACAEAISFADCVYQNVKEVDIGTIAMKRHSRTNSYGSLYGFVRSIDSKKRYIEVIFASAGQKMSENDVVYLGEENLVIKGQPVMNQLCIVNSGNLKGAYGITINSMTKEVMLEIGVKVVCRDCSMVQIVAEKKIL